MATVNAALIRKATPVGAQRRVRALMARAWPIGEIARHTGIDVTALQRLLARRTATPDHVRLIALAYELLWDRLPPQDTPDRRAAADATLEHARRCRWAPPMAWDDDALDDPAGRPAGNWRPGRSSKYRSADLAEDARFVREHGGYRHASTAEVARRLGVSLDQLHRACQRAGMDADTTVRSGKVGIGRAVPERERVA